MKKRKNFRKRPKDDSKGLSVKVWNNNVEGALKVFKRKVKDSNLMLDLKKKAYYEALGKCNSSLDASEWVAYFENIIVRAQKKSIEQVEFLIFKSKLLHQIAGKINSRQEKVVLRLFEAGPEGFSGGLSAENYIRITKTSRATATRDLTDLVKLGVLRKTGERRHTRYWLHREG